MISSRRSVDLSLVQRKIRETSQSKSNSTRADREDFIEFALHAFISPACRDERYVFWLLLHATSLAHLSNKWVMSSGEWWKLTSRYFRFLQWQELIEWLYKVQSEFLKEFNARWLFHAYFTATGGSRHKNGSQVDSDLYNDIGSQLRSSATSILIWIHVKTLSVHTRSQAFFDVSVWMRKENAWKR